MGRDQVISKFGLGPIDLQNSIFLENKIVEGFGNLGPMTEEKQMLLISLQGGSHYVRKQIYVPHDR